MNTHRFLFEQPVSIFAQKAFYLVPKVPVFIYQGVFNIFLSDVTIIKKKFENLKGILTSCGEYGNVVSE
jgi:hypothetical protein